MHKFFSVAALAAVTAALGACGGSSFGGGSSSGGTGTNPGGTTTYSMGSGSGSSFQSGVIKIANPTVAAGGTDSLEVSIVDNTGALYTAQPVTVTFSSSCISQGLATIAASNTSTAGGGPGAIVTATGTAYAVYTAKGCSGADVITASATPVSTTLSATGTLTAQAGAVGAIQFVSATPVTIGLKGTGLGEQSTVVFLVVDSSGAPRPGTTVTFSLPTDVGGATMAPTSAISGTDGKVQTVVSSGTQHTTLRVTATIASPALSTQSSQLAITTGVPVSDTFSISVGPADYSGVPLVTTPAPACSNVEAAGLNQIRVPITVSLADRYSNPAPDGTAVAFTTDAGKVGGSCNVSTSGKPTDGECTVTWSSEDPRPSTSGSPPSMINNRGVILATAIGEESFTDSNGNGFYEVGEPFKNLGEPFADYNENTFYETQEYFLDFNHNGQRDAPDGVFKGIVCTGSGASASCSSTPWAIGTSHVIIMSTSGAQLSVAGVSSNATVSSSGISVPHGGNLSVLVNVQDRSGRLNTSTNLLENGNPIAAGSSIVMVINGGGTALTNTGIGTYIQGCSTRPGGDNYQFNFGAVTAGSYTVTITVTAEATKTVSSITIPVTVT